MAKPRGSLAARKTPRAPWNTRDRSVPAKRVLCVLPRRIPANPLKRLLVDYELNVADSRTGALKAARKDAHDLVVIYAPLGWADAAEVCVALKALDPHTPLAVYSTMASAAERREVTATGAAYVGRADDAHNLAGTANQLVMLAELRSMEALAARSRALEDDLVRRLGKWDDNAAALPGRNRRLKEHARRLFSRAGGNRANFERVWPALYEAALRTLREKPRA
jgi:hypothetical protein